MLPWPELFTHVRDEHAGVLVAADGIPFGISTRAVRRRATVDALAELYPRAWLLHGVAPSRPIRTVAAARAVGGRVVVTGWSAAALMGLAEAPARPALLLPHDRRTRPQLAGVEVHRSRSIAVRDTIEVAGVRCTSLARTALFLSAIGASPVRVRDLLIDGIQRRVTTMGDVIDLLERSRGVSGRPVLDRVVAELVRDQVDSGLELDVRQTARRHGLVPYAYPFPLACPDRYVVHLDVALPDLFHTIECDGMGAHMDRRTFETDRVRWGAILRAGVGITWVTRRRLRDDLGGILEELADARARVDPERPPLVAAHDCRQVCHRV